MKKNWIKFSDCKPTQADFPYWVAGGSCVAPHLVTFANCHAGDRTHWQRAIVPAPPPRELTEWEKEEEAFNEWEYYSGLNVTPKLAWHAAIAYKRAGILECLTKDS